MSRSDTVMTGRSIIDRLNQSVKTKEDLKREKFELITDENPYFVTYLNSFIIGDQVCKNPEKELRFYVNFMEYNFISQRNNETYKLKIQYNEMISARHEALKFSFLIHRGYSTKEYIIEFPCEETSTKFHTIIWPELYPSTK
jgi:hypothetical protein